jgi:hypothetical protein
MTRWRAVALAVGALALTGNAVASQTHDHHAGGHAGKESREIKALSAEEMAGYLAGEGMGMALAAELNGWPGPRHVLDLADPLGLDSATVAEVRAIHARMLAEATRLGEEYVAREQELDHRFARRHIDPDRLAAITEELGRLQGALRLAHLRAHLETTALLTDAQIRRYDELRGYAGH